MSRRRFYAAPEDIIDTTVSLSVDETHHLTRVLRLKPGDEIFVFDGRGREYRCGFLALVGNRARLQIKEALTAGVESPLRLTLAQALAKGEKFDFIVQKATELGVSRIAPLVTEHTDVKLREEQTGKRLERWQRISLEALKQSGRRSLVEISAPATLAEFLNADRLSPRSTFVFSERGGAVIDEALAGLTSATEVCVLVGPEGGWSDAELRLLDERGVKGVTLGPRVLRTETAALAAVTLVQHALGDLSSGERR